MIFNDFFILGFDFRSTNATIYTADSLLWEKSDVSCTRFIQQGHSQSFTTLLFDATAQEIENNTDSDTIAICVAIKYDFLNFLKKNGHILPKTIVNPSYLLDRGWNFVGYDVTSVSELYSIFDMDPNHKVLPKGTDSLFLNINDAENIIGNLTSFIPEHAPYTTSAIFIYSK